MGVLVASPPTTQLDLSAVNRWPGVTAMTWTGADGRVWDLLRGTDGVVLLESGIRGLAMPEIRRHTSSSPSLAGTRWRGWRVEEREVFWPVLVWSEDSTRDWLQRDSAWWGSLHPERLGVWEVTTARAGRRRLSLRFTGDGEHSFPVDPARLGEAVYGVRLVAEQPLWEGDDTLSSWSLSEQAAFFPGPPFWIGSAYTLATATLTNPGDVPAYAVWTVQGPFTSARVGMPGATVSVPFGLPDGAALTIDTRPHVMSAVDSSGADRTRDLGAAAFAPVPAGYRMPLDLALGGQGGRITASLTPLFLRAW